MVMAQLATRVTLALLLGIAPLGCAGNFQTPSGSLRFNVLMPQQQGRFGIKAIPPQTTRFTLLISGENMSQSRTETLNVDGSTRSQTHVVSALPLGEKLVTVTALDADGKALAEASTRVIITASATARAELDLRSLLETVTVRLATGLPLTLNVRTNLTGEGLETPLSSTETLALLNSSFTLDDVPNGSKNLSLTLSTTVSGQTLTSSAISRQIQVISGTGATVELSFVDVLTAFRSQLETLAAGFPPEQLINVFLQVPTRLDPQLRTLLPQSVKVILGVNPVLAERLGITLPQPSATPIPQPSVTPEPTPTPTVSNDLSIARVRLVKRPIRILLENTESLLDTDDTQISTLGDQTETLPLGQELHAAVVRLNYDGQDTPVISMRVQNLDNAEAAINHQIFPASAALRTSTGVFSLLIPLLTDTGAMVLDAAGRYRVTVEARALNGAIVSTKTFEGVVR